MTINGPHTLPMFALKNPSEVPSAHLALRLPINESTKSYPEVFILKAQKGNSPDNFGFWRVRFIVEPFQMLKKLCIHAITHHLFSSVESNQNCCVVWTFQAHRRLGISQIFISWQNIPTLNGRNKDKERNLLFLYVSEGRPCFESFTNLGMRLTSFCLTGYLKMHVKFLHSDFQLLKDVNWMQ